MKIALPSKEEVGRWMTGGSVIWAASIVKSRNSPDFWWLSLVTFGMTSAAILLYLTIRANIYAFIRRRKRSDVASE